MPMAELFTDFDGSRHVRESDYTGNKGKCTSRVLTRDSRKLARVFKILCMLDIPAKERARNEIERALNVAEGSLYGEVEVSCNKGTIRVFISEKVDRLRKDVRDNGGLRSLTSFAVKAIEELSEKIEGTQIDDLV